jgi:hypothetical protein
MSSIITPFSEFEPEENLNESNWFSSLISKTWTGFTDVITTKVAAYLLKFLGIGETSIFSKLVQNFVEQIPLSDYPKIFFKKKADSKYLAPKAADATIEFLTDVGLDGVAEKLGIEPTGYIYRTINEMISNETKRKGFRENLEVFYLNLFSSLSFSDGKFGNTFSSSEKNKIGSEIQKAARKQVEETGKSKIEGSAEALLNNLFKNSPVNAGSTAILR